MVHQVQLVLVGHVPKTQKSALLDAPMVRLVPFLLVLSLPLKHPESASVARSCFYSGPERTYQTLTLERVRQVLAARCGEEWCATTSNLHLHFRAFSRCFCSKRLTVIHTYIHTMTLQCPSKDTSICRPGRSNQQPSSNKTLALPLSHSSPCLLLVPLSKYTFHDSMELLYGGLKVP